MTKVLNIFLSLFFISLLIYIYPVSPEFPQPPVGVVQSDEPADVETPFRRGYYTNLNRDEVVSHYQSEFKNQFGVYTLRLNYPPEEAQTLIRDQTKSTFLEELAHPLRESLYINGFEPKTVEYAQFYKGIQYNQKIIIRYVPSIVWQRVLILGLTFAVSLVLIREYKYV